MSTDRPTRVRVAWGDETWAEEVARLEKNSRVRLAAERERRRLGSVIDVAQLRACSSTSRDGTDLTGMAKVYVPVSDGPPSDRPYGFVFVLARDADGLYLEFVAYGERHPTNPDTRNVYERAHKRRHGRFPGQ